MDFYEVISRRQSTRQFQDQAVPVRLLERIVKAGQQAPISMHRSDSYQISLVTRKSTLAKIEDSHQAAGKHNPIYDAPALLVVAGDTSISDLHLAMDAACIIDHMHLAATAEGLGSVYICGLFYSEVEHLAFVEDLQLPEGYRAVAGLAIGRPMQHPEKREDRTEIQFSRCE